MPRLSHYFNYTVERYGMMAIREGSVEVCIQSSGGSKGISLDARNLNQSANRVAGHSEMMLQSHFGSIFYLSRTASEKLAGCSRSHGAGNTYLALATYISTTDRSILLYDVAHQSGCSQGSQDALFTHIMRSKHVVEYSWQYTTGATGRSCNDGTTRSILFAHSQRISINQAAALQGSTVTFRLYIIGGSLTL